MRSDTIEARSLTDPVLYEQKIQLAREMARVLRQNVVQAEKVQGEGEDKWSKITFCCSIFETHPDGRTSVDETHRAWVQRVN